MAGSVENDRDGADDADAGRVCKSEPDAVGTRQRRSLQDTIIAAAPLSENRIERPIGQGAVPSGLS
jgi:hypothetical protein